MYLAGLPGYVYQYMAVINTDVSKHREEEILEYNDTHDKHITYDIQTHTADCVPHRDNLHH